jgi:4-hydroxy-2-oxoglutarate aldolase
MNPDLSGIFAPVTSPFDPVTGDLDVVGLRRNVRRLLEAPIAGIVAFGSTGEGLLVDDRERAAGVDAVRSLLADRLLLVACSAESTRAVIRLVREAAAGGADAALVAPPAYFRPQMTPEALHDHYVAVADAAPVPLVLYQVPPAFSGIELESGLVAELARHPNIVGIKDSRGNLRDLGSLVTTCPRDFVILVGNGGVVYGALEVGAHGGILAVATIAPAESAGVYAHKRAGDEAAAGAGQERIARLQRDIVSRFGIPGVKAALDLLGQVGGSPRPPLKPLREKQLAVVRDALEAAGLLERGVRGAAIRAPA